MYTGNYEFGISRIIKSLEPYDKKLGTDTWYYAKRCFLALAESLAKHMLSLQDSTYEEIKRFLDDVGRAFHDRHDLLDGLGQRDGEGDDLVVAGGGDRLIRRYWGNPTGYQF